MYLFHINITISSWLRLLQVRAKIEDRFSASSIPESNLVQRLRFKHKCLRVVTRSGPLHSWIQRIYMPARSRIQPAGPRAPGLVASYSESVSRPLQQGPRRFNKSGRYCPANGHAQVSKCCAGYSLHHLAFPCGRLRVSALVTFNSATFQYDAKSSDLRKRNETKVIFGI